MNYAPGAINAPSPNHSPRRDATVDAVVIHIEGGSEGATDDWFSRPESQASAHFSVAKDGTVRQFVSLADAAWANGIVDDIDHGYAQGFLASLPANASPNRYTVSIEHEGNTGDALAGAQFDASVKLAAWLFGPDGPLAGKPCDRYHVIRHSEIGSHPLCPGFTEANIARYILAVNAALTGHSTEEEPVVDLDPVVNADEINLIQSLLTNMANGKTTINKVRGSNPTEYRITVGA